MKPFSNPSGLPRLALTMGDPTGVGPEVIAAVWADPAVHAVCRPAVVGCRETMLRAADSVVGSAGPAVVAMDDGGSAFEAASPETLPCLSPGALASGLPGEAAHGAVVTAAKMALGGVCEGIVTAPLSKANLQAAGHDYPGHTELLAELCGARDFAMMLYLPPAAGSPVRGPHGLGVVHVTLHTALRKVFELLTPEAVAEKCRLADRMLRRLGTPRPRVAVAALNPHAGEGGLFGDEEQRVIAPAVEQAKSEGIDASGPHSTDTLMGRARDGEFDAVVAMYHDQGHIALKLLDMHGAVNITCGLPIVRTSVAHGTATDLAWKGAASGMKARGIEARGIETRGMLAAIHAAAKLSATGPQR